MIAKSVLELIGNTPIISLKEASQFSGCNVFAKCEFLNPTHSIKDRIGSGMILDAFEKGLIDKNSTIIEATSGNTGIALGAVCASLGLKLILTMPSSMSLERRKLLEGLGAKIVLTKPSLGMRGSVEKAKELQMNIKKSYILSQFDNPSNPKAHAKTTAVEILEQMNEVKIDIFVASVGTGGTISGIGKVLKEYNPNVKIVAVEPEESSVLSGKKPGIHKIQGIGAGFIPKVLDRNIYDEVFEISYKDAFNTARELAKKEGLLVGLSSGANVFASKMMGQKEKNRGKNILTILCDSAERYISSGLYD